MMNRDPGTVLRDGLYVVGDADLEIFHTDANIV